MSDPKTKAKELYDKFEKIFIDANADSWGKEAKQCVLIAVDEMFQIAKALVGNKQLLYNNSHYKYWQQVKEEIEKL